MNKYYYDLHIHSCLSPCGDEDMTPANIAGMAAVKGLSIAALTDHNSTKNCPAFFDCCKAYGIIPVAGAEVTTAEDIHLLCLFRSLADAMCFGERLDAARVRVRNRPEIFGRQLIMNSDDEIIGEESDLLLNAVSLSLEEATALCRECGGVCHPAHIDRESNGAVAILGAFPDWLGYSSYEVSGTGNREALEGEYPILKMLTFVRSSDAHYLGDISEAESYFELEDEPYSSNFVRNRLIDKLEGKA